MVGGAALLFTAILVAFLRFKNNKAEGSSDDSWERSEERRRRKEAVYGGASYVLLFCCAGVAAALSFHGLVGFGQQNLNLSGGWEYLVPFGLDGAAMFCSVLAVREASHGDAALGSRMLVWLFAVASAWFNWVHAPRGGAHDGAPQFFAGMSISAAVLFDRALKQTRRAALREQGLVPRPLPQIRVVRWLRAPRETYAAWSLMLLENVRSLDEAVEEVREERQAKLDAKVRARSADRRERAELKAISRQTGMLGRARHGRQVPALAAAGDSPSSATEPALAAEETTLDRVGPSALEPAALNAGRRPRAAVESPSTGSPYSSSIDLTMDEDTLSMPKLDSLERKLRAIEQQLG
ncbi:membrane protein [Kitasatospora griseola]|nr:membrane protein [Kitasatospora griseola]